MVERTPVVIKTGQGKDVTSLKKYVTLEVATIDDADTITVDALSAIDSAKVIDLATGSDVTVTTATNVVTIDDVGVSSDHVIVLVVGT